MDVNRTGWRQLVDWPSEFKFSNPHLKVFSVFNGEII